MASYEYKIKSIKLLCWQPPMCMDGPTVNVMSVGGPSLNTFKWSASQDNPKQKTITPFYSSQSQCCAKITHPLHFFKKQFYKIGQKHLNFIFFLWAIFLLLNYEEVQKAKYKINSHARKERFQCQRKLWLWNGCQQVWQLSDSCPTMVLASLIKACKDMIVLNIAVRPW